MTQIENWKNQQKEKFTGTMFKNFYTLKSYGRNLGSMKKPSGSKSAFLSTNYDSFPKSDKASTQVTKISI